MGKIKKAVSLILAMVMTMAMSLTAFAAEKGTITVANPMEGQEYTAYKIFDYTGDVQDEADQANPVAYTMAKTNDWVSDVSAPSSPQIPAQIPALCAFSIIILIALSKAG